MKIKFYSLTIFKTQTFYSLVLKTKMVFNFSRFLRISLSTPHKTESRLSSDSWGQKLHVRKENSSRYAILCGPALIIQRVQSLNRTKTLALNQFGYAENDAVTGLSTFKYWFDNASNWLRHYICLPT